MTKRLVMSAEILRNSLSYSGLCMYLNYIMNIRLAGKIMNFFFKKKKHTKYHKEHQPSLCKYDHKK